MGQWRYMVVLLALGVALPLLRAQTDAEEAFWAAARKGDLAGVKSALEAGIPVDAKTRHGLTALFYAAQNGHLEVVKLLVDKGADVNIKDTFYGMTALARAVDQDRPAVVEFLLERGAKDRDQVLIGASGSGKADIVGPLLQKGGFSEITMTQALQSAQRAKQTLIADLLKRAGAKPPEPPKFVDLDAQKLTPFAGTWRSPQMDVTVDVKDGKLRATFGGGPVLFGALSETKFQGVEMDNLQLEFQPDGMKVTQGSFSLMFKKVESK